MRILDKEQFLKYKKSDTIVIYGSGPSVKNLSEEDKNILNKFDSIGFNCFSRTGIEPTFYIIGEMLFNYYRADKTNHKLKGSSVTDIFKQTGEDPTSYLKSFEKFDKTCFIIWDHKYITQSKEWKQFNKTKNNGCIYVKQYGHEPSLQETVKGKRGQFKIKFDPKIKGKQGFINKKHYTQDLLLSDNILLHSWKGVNSAIFVAKCLGYKNVIFSGVDLGNYGPDAYAFDRSQFVNKFISQIRKGYKTHPCKEMLFKFIEYLKNDINFYTYNPNSLLVEIIPVYNPRQHTDHCDI